jgi:gas vesicle protein
MSHSGVLNFCIGTAVGIGMAMLIAPKSGKATRSLIKHSGMEFRDKAIELARKRTEAITQQRDGVAAALRAGKRAYAKAMNS